MNWGLVLRLSPLGLAMGLGTLFATPASIEPACRLITSLLCAYFVARHCNDEWFLNGFVIGIVNSIWVTSVHILFFVQYMSGHDSETELVRAIPPPHFPRLMLVATGAAIGILTGILIGVLSSLAARLRRLRRSA